MNEQQLKLQYRKRPFITLLMFLLALFFGHSIISFDFDNNRWIYIILVASFCFFLFGCIYQLVLWNKKYHFFIDKKNRKIYIENGLRKDKVISLDDILGMSYDSTTINSTTTYTLQFKVMPHVWGKYYNKNSHNVIQSENDYKCMFISIGIINQNKKDIQKLILFLSECGLKSMDFQKTTFGKANGIIKKHSIDIQSKEYKRILHRQWLSYFFKWLLVLYLVFYFIFQLLGRTNGIYW
ncbi:hypothetical protein [Enterococcus sp. DIV0800]|uniref:hypothetical protein n=1 Tax=unclassified Enterococcus TaxID=2608891 RepID=UPI003D2FA1EF